MKQRLPWKVRRTIELVMKRADLSQDPEKFLGGADPMTKAQQDRVKLFLDSWVVSALKEICKWDDGKPAVLA